MLELENATKKRASIIDYKGSWNIGAYGLATDKYAIFGNGFRSKIINDAREVLEVPVITQNIMDEPIVGILAIGNSNGLLVPPQTSDEEIKKLKAFLEIPIERLSLKNYENALGNLLLANDKYCLMHTETAEKNKKSLEVIEDILDVEIITYNFSFTIIGTVATMTNKGILLHPEMRDEEIDFLKNNTGLRAGKGTVNMGSPYVRSGLIANTHGFLAGLRTTGLELQRIYEILIM